MSKPQASKNKRKPKSAAAPPDQTPLRYTPFRPRRAFAMLGPAGIYALFWVLCLVFTQALQSPLSAVLFLFATMLPFFNLAYVFFARRAVEIELYSSVQEAAKGDPVGYRIRVCNSSLLPLPFLEADILVPNAGSVRCQTRRLYLSAAPRGAYEVSGTVRFSYRGEYDLGVSDVYIYDFFRMFRLRAVLNRFQPVYVLPRRTSLEQLAGSAVSDVNTESQRNARGIDRAEMSDIRDYRMGDHMKTIHWKLSSKTEELQVKEYAMNTGKTAYLFLDMAAHYPAPDADGLYADDINEYCADGVVEIALAAAADELKAGNSCRVIWYDSRRHGSSGASGAQICTLESVADLDRNFRLFASIPLCGAENDVSRLAALIEETQGVSVIFVTAQLSGTLVDGLAEASALLNSVSSAGAIELYYKSPAARIPDAAEAERVKNLADSCIAQLRDKGIRAVTIQKEAQNG